MHPYRQPPEPPKPPGDPMRVIVWVTGGVAALIALAAIGLRVSEHFTTKEEPVVVTRKRAPDLPPLPTNEVVVHHVVDAGPRILPDGPLAFMASGHSGDVYTTTWIVEDGRATLSMSVSRGDLFCPPSEKRVSAADLAALAAHARSIHVENMSSNYIRRSGHFASTMVSGGDQQFRIMHPEPSDIDDAGADVAAISSLHEHIQRLAGTALWAKTCKRTETNALRTR